MSVLALWPEPHARTAIVQKLNPGLFQDSHDPAKCVRSRADGFIECFHPTDSPESYVRPFAKVALRPAEEGAARANVPTRYNDQPKRYHECMAKLN